MQSKASVADADNGPLFDLIKQPLRRVEVHDPRRIRAVRARLADANPLMEFANAPAFPEEKSKAQRASDATVLPEWAIARSPLQPVLEYTDAFGYRCRQYVVHHKWIQDQDIETRLTIERIFQGGGSNIQLDILSVASGTTVARWAVSRGKTWRTNHGYIEYRLIGLKQLQEAA